MTVIQRRHPALADAFCHRQHRSVDEAESEVRVGRQELTEPDVVTWLEPVDDERAAPHVLQEGEKGPGCNEVVELHEDGRGNQANAVPRTQRLRAASMVLVVRVEQRDEGPGVDYECNGRGSWSSLARRARSPFPEANAPAQQMSGTGTAGPSSRSSASPTSCATETPRSAALRFAWSSSAMTAPTRHIRVDAYTLSRMSNEGKL